MKMSYLIFSLHKNVKKDKKVKNFFLFVYKNGRLGYYITKQWYIVEESGGFQCSWVNIIIT